MKCSLGISNFLEEISSFSHSIVFLYFFALILRKAFLFLLAILWNSAFKWIYLSFSPLPLVSLLFSPICKPSSDNHLPFCIFFFLEMVFITPSCTISQTSIHSFSGTLSDLIPWIYLQSLPLYNHKGFIWFSSYLNGLAVFPTFFNFSLNFPIRGSSSEPQSAPSLVFADCIELLHFWLQRI